MSRQLGENHWNSKLTSEQVKEIRKLFDAGFSYKLIARNFKISTWNVQEIGKRETWKHL
mgnify:CR=1 FL=1